MRNCADLGGISNWDSETRSPDSPMSPGVSAPLNQNPQLKSWLASASQPDNLSGAPNGRKRHAEAEIPSIFAVLVGLPSVTGLQDLSFVRCLRRWRCLEALAFMSVCRHVWEEQGEKKRGEEARGCGNIFGKRG
eukprot:scaffold7366_cov254-Pinguiococcus_pyrenoidosus.AAC.4